MEGFTKAKALNAILVQARTLPLGSPSSTSASAPVAIASAAPALDLQALLIGIVAERTGYPHEMLGLGAAPEADLGFDSVKRAEIPGSFQKPLPADAGPQMPARMEQFHKPKTLLTIRRPHKPLTHPGTTNLP